MRPPGRGVIRLASSCRRARSSFHTAPALSGVAAAVKAWMSPTSRGRSPSMRRVIRISPRSSRRPGGIGPARFEVLPVVGAGVIAVEFLTQMFRIVTVDEHERFADGESVEPGEDQGVSLRLGYLAHVQSCVASGSPVSGSAAEPCKFVDSSIPPSYYYEYILCKFLTCDLCDRPAVCGCEGPCLRGGMPGGLHL